MRRLLAAAAVLVLALPGAAAADAICSVTATPVNFGDYTGDRLTSTGTITLTCIGSGRQDYSIALSTGRSGSFRDRTLTSGADVLDYNLFTSALHLQVWGDGSQGSGTVNGHIDFDFGQIVFRKSHTVYGKIERQREDPMPGDYNDTITVTVTY